MRRMRKKRRPEPFEAEIARVLEDIGLRVCKIKAGGRLSCGAYNAYTIVARLEDGDDDKEAV